MQYLARRLALSVLVLFGVSILIFTMVRLLPGDVIDMMIGTEGSMSASQQHTVREQFGLNDAWPVQYVRWMGGILQGNLGKSFRTQQEVLPLIAARLPTTIELAVLSIVVSSVIAIPLGVISALSRNGWTDFVARLLGLIGLSVPNFWLATILILAASFWFRWSASASWPLTTTAETPSAYWCGFSKVARSAMVAGSKTTTSAKRPAASVPRSWRPRLAAGRPLRRRIASGISAMSSRTRIHGLTYTGRLESVRHGV